MYRIVYGRIPTRENPLYRVEIYEDKKLRFGIVDDEWQVLERSAVPNLTEEEWQSAPSPDWHLISRGEA